MEKMNRFGIAWFFNCVIIGPASICHEQLIGNGKLISPIQNLNSARRKAVKGPFAIPIS